VFLAPAFSPARAQDITDTLKARQTAFAQWQTAHPDAEAQIAELKAKTAALVAQSGAASNQPYAIWRIEGAIGEVWDMPETPQMTIVPAGSYVMGSPASEPGRSKFEGPQHVVTIGYPFAIGKYDVTFDEWDLCVASGGCNGYQPDDNGWGRGSRPVINVSWNDAQAYISWLNAHTGKKYRLPSDAEWEYAARAGTTTAFPWGDDASHDYANYGQDQCCGGAMVGWDRWFNTAPVGSFPANKFGLFDMSGNVLQYVQDCWQPGYNGVPVDGSARDDSHCAVRTLRGGSWSSIPAFLRSADRIWTITQARFNIIGFRVARTL